MQDICANDFVIVIVLIFCTLLTLPEHFRSPSVFGGGLVLSFLCCVLCAITCLIVFLFFNHGVVSLFSIYEFERPSDIFRLSFESFC